jgi:hypothetical protein
MALREDAAPFVFPPWVDRLWPVIGLAAGAVATWGVALLYYGGSPRTTDVGYQPVQPVPYSHALHAGELGLDCRYCHDTVERAAHAALPATEVCMNCHAAIAADSPLLAPVRASHATGMPVAWVRVHDLPDYVYFDHSAHVRRGVGCVECHGRVDRMEVVYQAEPLSMGWCLDCHRRPQGRLRPLDQIANMDWRPDGSTPERAVRPSEDCSTCHR